MKIRIIQPPYPKKPEDVEQTVSFMIKELDECSSEFDLVLLPECCNAPCGCSDKDILEQLYNEFTELLYQKASETAVKCHAIVGINMYLPYDDLNKKVRNSTVLFGCDGKISARYDKIHLPKSEYSNSFIDHEYIKNVCAPTLAVVEGIRFSFITCYDVYYTEMINRISEDCPDIVIICSLQRAERHEILELQGKLCSFITNAYTVRSSYYMGENTTTGGCSMICAPDGTLIANMGNTKGHMDTEIGDVHKKYMRSNGFGQPFVLNNEYQTMYRAPWTYRAAGCAVVQNNLNMSYPRLCANKGIVPAPKDTIASIAMAISLNSQEVAIDVTSCADGTLMVGPKGSDFDCIIDNPHFQGLHYSSFETVIRKFQQQAVFNICIEDCQILEKAIEILRKYDCIGYAYISSKNEEVILKASEQIATCFVSDDYKKAIALKCSRIEVENQFISKDFIGRIHENNLLCNVSGILSLEDGKRAIENGADCLISDNIIPIMRLIKS